MCFCLFWSLFDFLLCSSLFFVVFVCSCSRVFPCLFLFSLVYLVISVYPFSSCLFSCCFFFCFCFSLCFASLTALCKWLFSQVSVLDGFDSSRCCWQPAVSSLLGRLENSRGQPLLCSCDPTPPPSFCLSGEWLVLCNWVLCYLYCSSVFVFLFIFVSFCTLSY